MPDHPVPDSSATTLPEIPAEEMERYKNTPIGTDPELDERRAGRLQEIMTSLAGAFGAAPAVEAVTSAPAPAADDAADDVPLMGVVDADAVRQELAAYASFRAFRSANPDLDDEAFSRFFVADDPAAQEVDELWQRRFDDEPAKRERFESLHERYCRWFGGGTDGGDSPGTDNR